MPMKFLVAEANQGVRRAIAAVLRGRTHEAHEVDSPHDVLQEIFLSGCDVVICGNDPLTDDGITALATSRAALFAGPFIVMAGIDKKRLVEAEGGIFVPRSDDQALLDAITPFERFDRPSP